MKTLPKSALILAAALLAFGLGFALQGLTDRPAGAPDIEGLLWPPGEPLAPFSLTDQDGEPFDRGRLQGRWTLLFFGFTHCPDVCPATLQVMDTATRRAVAAGVPAEDLQVVMVSVDPARDTPQQLDRYLDYFNEDFIGVTGPDERLGALTRQLGALYVREPPGADGSYNVDHTAALFLIDPLGRRIAVFSAPHVPEDLAGRIAAIHRFVETS